MPIGWLQSLFISMEGNTMKRLTLAFVLILFTYPAVQCDDTTLSNQKFKILRNRVFTEKNQVPQAGDTVMVQPVDLIADNIFKTPDEIVHGNELSKYKHHQYLNPYRMTHIIRTWLDYKKLLFEFARKEGVEIRSQQDRERVAAKMYMLTGIRPLRKNQVLVAMNSTLEATYDVRNIGLMKNITSDFFHLGEKVIYSVYTNNNSFQQEGTVAGITPSGLLVVQRGMHFTKIYPEDLFSSEKNYNHRFNLNEKVIYKFKRVNGNLVTEENGKVVGVSPKGDIIIYVNKMGQLVKIMEKDASSNSEKVETSLISKLPVFCSNLFN